MFRLPPARLALVATLCLAACSSVRHRDDVAALVGSVAHDNLVATVQALSAIGPRPVMDEDKTLETLDYLRAQLQTLGYQVEIKTYTRELSGNFIARVRPAGDTAAEFYEIDVPLLYAQSGPSGMQAYTETLRAEGYEVRGYFYGSAGEGARVPIRNLLAVKPGRDPDAGIVELSAHYDTVANCPGADDNSSGVAALLEVARVLSDVPLESSLRLCFFGAEEMGLWGSSYHAAEFLAKGVTPPVEALVNLDSIGFTSPTASSASFPDGLPWYVPIPDEGNFALVVGQFSEGWIGNVFEDSADTYDTGLVYYSANRIGAWFDDARRSDHAHYWDADVPAVFVTDSGGFRSEHYHQPSDTIETLDFDFITAITRATLATAVHLAGLAGPG